MAEFLSQDDINNLLSETMEVQEQETEKPAEASAPKQGAGKRRFFRKPDAPPFRYSREYRSPVLRPKQFSYNPEPTATEEAEGRLIVRSLDNYVQHVKERATLQHK